MLKCRLEVLKTKHDVIITEQKRVFVSFLLLILILLYSKNIVTIQNKKRDICPFLSHAFDLNYSPITPYSMNS